MFEHEHKFDADHLCHEQKCTICQESRPRIDARAMADYILWTKPLPGRLHSYKILKGTDIDDIAEKYRTK